MRRHLRATVETRTLRGNMRGVPSQVVNRLRLFLLAVACWFCLVPTAHAIRPPTIAEELQLKEKSARPEPSLDNAIFIRAGEMRIGLFVGNNPINNIDPLGLEGNPIMGLGGAWNNNASGGGGSFYGPGFYQSLAIQQANAAAAAQAAAIAAYNARVPSDFWLDANGNSMGGIQTDDGVFSLLAPFLAPEAGSGNLFKSKCPVASRGSTADLAKGTSLPRNLREKLAVDQAAANPAAGESLPFNMTDPRWPGSQGWEKWQQVIKPGGDPINVHYLRNPVTGQIDDFKIVLPGAR